MKLSKSEVIALRQKALNQAKYNAKKWFDNGWGNQIVACVDVVYPDGSREITFKDALNNFNKFDFLYDGNVFAFVQYGKDGIKITKGEKMRLSILDDNLAKELELTGEKFIIKNVNSGVDPSRIQENKPAYFVNWNENGENKYAFFSIPSVAETCKQRLLKEQGV